MKATSYQKQVIKMLARKIQEQLGNEQMTYHSIEEVELSHEDMKLSNQEFDEDKEYNRKIPVAHAVNHRRRLRRAFESNGTAGIIRHMQKCGLRLNEKKLEILLNGKK